MSQFKQFIQGPDIPENNMYEPGAFRKYEEQKNDKHFKQLLQSLDVQKNRHTCNMPPIKIDTKK